MRQRGYPHTDDGDELGSAAPGCGTALFVVVSTGLFAYVLNAIAYGRLWWP